MAGSNGSDIPATWYIVHGQNDAAWRCEYPAKAVGGRMEIIREKHAARLIMWPHNQGPAQWHLELEYLDGVRETVRTKGQYQAWLKRNPDWVSEVLQARSVFPNHHGTAIWVRPDHPRAALAETMREQHGIRTLGEVDDNYLSDPHLNLALRAYKWDREQQVAHIESLASMDGIVFSTELLRDMYWKEIKNHWRRTKHANAPWLELHVCRNHVAAEDWPARVERDGPVRVGWMGSPSHVWDLDLAWAAMLYARQNGAETWIVGYNPVDDNIHDNIIVDGAPLPLSARSQHKIDAWRKVQFRHVPWRQPEQYERLALPFDIGLCPLLTNRNTLGKSDVKFVEYTVSGAATVAQNNAVYNRTIIHGETGLLAGSPSEMIDCVKLLMRDEKLRLELVANAQQYVRENRGGKQLRQEWLAAIN